MSESWQRSLAAFFAERATGVEGRPSFVDLCHISGRDPRLWQMPEVYDDLVEGLVRQLDLGPGSRVLEVGSASGFLAQGIAPRVGAYVGVDLAREALAVARRLGLSNARFEPADGARLPFAEGEFDAAFCYDVFTNFPSIADGIPIIAEMLRVVRSGGPVLVGSIPDADRRGEYEARVAEVGRLLQSQPAPPSPAAPRTRHWSPWAWLRARIPGRVTPQIVCYYFPQSDFRALGAQLGARVDVLDIHAKNPYLGLRFNAVFTRPGP